MRTLPQSTRTATHCGHLPEERCKIEEFWSEYVSAGGQTAPDHRSEFAEHLPVCHENARNLLAVDRNRASLRPDVPHLTRCVPYLTRSAAYRTAPYLPGLHLADLLEVHRQPRCSRGVAGLLIEPSSCFARYVIRILNG